MRVGDAPDSLIRSPVSQPSRVGGLASGIAYISVIWIFVTLSWPPLEASRCVRLVEVSFLSVISDSP